MRVSFYTNQVYSVYDKASQDVGGRWQKEEGGREEDSE